MMRFRVFFVVILDNMETALVHVKMDISFLEIGRSGFPYKRIRVITLYCRPYRLANAFALDSVFHIQKIQVIVVSFWIDLNNRTADDTAVLYGSICHTSSLAE